MVRARSKGSDAKRRIPLAKSVGLTSQAAERPKLPVNTFIVTFIITSTHCQNFSVVHLAAGAACQHLHRHLHHCLHTPSKILYRQYCSRNFLSQHSPSFSQSIEPTIEISLASNLRPKRSVAIIIVIIAVIVIFIINYKHSQKHKFLCFYMKTGPVLPLTIPSKLTMQPSMSIARTDKHNFSFRHISTISQQLLFLPTTTAQLFFPQHFDNRTNPLQCGHASLLSLSSSSPSSWPQPWPWHINR